MEESYKVEFAAKGDTWWTLWLIQKTIHEGQKKEVPFRIEIKSGSVETTISLTPNLAAIGVVVYNVIEYLRRKREQDRPLEITKFGRDVVYPYVLHHLKTIAKVPSAELVSEHRTKDEGYHFEFRETKSTVSGILVFKHIYTISRDFDVKYERKQEVVFT